ncbi:hypothetical protein Pcinc_034364 [Petrolisthes cinctipes]|uniref:Uncharacterized protein n=1 Tax=Petrolisthes cinctipes TaxID=88211 RepID=A0AAE1EQD8_PETCI|nr:hypothetical protein Pcinc_034364 [Petrolisthes cinctipes]
MVGVVTGEVAGEWRGGPEEVVVDALRQWPAKPIVASGNVATLSLSSTLEGPTHSQGVPPLSCLPQQAAASHHRSPHTRPSHQTFPASLRCF